MAKVGILMGSDSDLPIMSKAAKMLEDFGIEYEMKVISAHREVDILLITQRAHRSAALMLLLPVPVELRIFRACVRQFSHFR